MIIPNALMHDSASAPGAFTSSEYLSCFPGLLLDYPPHIRTMSRASKLTLAATGLGTAGIVYFVHWSQEQEKAVR